MERALFVFTFRSHQPFSVIFVLNKITAPIFQIIHIRSKTLNEEVLNEGIRSKLVPRVFLLFHINVKVRRRPRNEVTCGLNWTKESCDNARVRINSAF